MCDAHIKKMEPRVLTPAEEIVDEYAIGRAQEADPLDTEERERLTELLHRIPELRSYDTIVVRGRPWSSYRNFEEVIGSVVNTGIVIEFLTSDIVVRRIYEGAVLDNLRSAGVSTGRNLVSSYLIDAAEWRSYNLEDWRRIYERSLELDSALRDLPYGQLAQIVLSDRFQAGGDAQLLAELQQYGIDWRAVLLEVAREMRNSVDANEIVNRTLERLRETVAQRQQQMFGPASQLTREATDDFDIRRGLLSAGCVAWTYQELEYWARAAAAKAELDILRRWLVETQNEQGFDVDIQGELDRASLLEAVHPLIQTAAKRYLCRLLSATSFAAPVWGRESFSWHNLRVQSPYLDSLIVERIRQEIQQSIAAFPAEAEAGFGVDLQVERYGRPSVSDITMIQAIATDIARQQLPSFVGDRNEDVRVWRVDLAVNVPRIVEVGTTTVAWIGLSGSTLVSTLSRTGVDPARILLQIGDVLFLQGDGYDSAVLRAHEGPSQMLQIVFSRR